MNLYDPRNESLLARLARSIDRAIPSTFKAGGNKLGLGPGLTIPDARQSAPMTEDTINRIFGSKDEFMQRYKDFEDLYFDRLADPKNRALFANVSDMEMEKLSGKIDLTRLTFDSQQELKDIFLKNVLQAETLLPEVGLPGLEYPSGNLYRSLLQFQTENADHPVTALLRRMYFNVDPTKEGLQALDFGKSSMISSKTLERIGAEPKVDPGAKILTFDIESTGVLQTSQVRQFAYQVGINGGATGDMKVSSFENAQMDFARIRTRNGSQLLSQFVNEAETGRARTSNGRRWN